MSLNSISVEKLGSMKGIEEDYFFEDEIIGLFKIRDIIREFINNYQISSYRLYKIKDEKYDRETKLFFDWFNSDGKIYFDKILDFLIDGNVHRNDNFLKLLLRYSYLLEDAYFDQDVDLLINWLYEIPSSLFDKMVSYNYVVIEEDPKFKEFSILAKDVQFIEVNTDFFEVDNGLQIAGLSFI